METIYTPPGNGSAGTSTLDGVVYVPGHGAMLPVPQPPIRHRKIAILGFGETVKEAPVSDPSWELWAMNGFWRAAKPDFNIDVPEDRYSVWFDTHTIEYTREYGKQAGFGDAQERWLEQPHPFPILMLETCPAFPSVQRYPIEDVIATTGRDYFTSTIAYALALALTLPDVAEIGMWGVDLVHDTEYVHQRPCAEYWVGRAEALGIKVTAPARSALLKQQGRYGWDPENPLLKQQRAMLETQAAGIEKAIETNKERMEALRMQMHTDDGALQAIRGMLGRLDIFERGGVV